MGIRGYERINLHLRVIKDVDPTTFSTSGHLKAGDLVKGQEVMYSISVNDLPHYVNTIEDFIGYLANEVEHFHPLDNVWLANIPKEYFYITLIVGETAGKGDVLCNGVAFKKRPETSKSKFGFKI